MTMLLQEMPLRLFPKRVRPNRLVTQDRKITQLRLTLETRESTLATRVHLLSR
jgi:hypothetical protein